MGEDTGFIKIYRSMLRDPVWANSTMPQKVIFLTLLLSVQWQRTQWDINGKKFYLEPGQGFISTRRLAKDCGPDVSQKNVRTALARFEKMDFITTEKTHWGTLITIVNWWKYQKGSGFDTRTAQGVARGVAHASSDEERPVEPYSDIEESEGGTRGGTWVARKKAQKLAHGVAHGVAHAPDVAEQPVEPLSEVEKSEGGTWGGTRGGTCLAHAWHTNKQEDKKVRNKDIVINHHLQTTAIELGEDDGKNISDVIDHFSNKIHPVYNEVEAQSLQDLVESYGADLCIQAIDRAAEYKGRSVRYVTGILQNWERKGYTGDGNPPPPKKQRIHVEF